MISAVLNVVEIVLLSLACSMILWSTALIAGGQKNAELIHFIRMFAGFTILFSVRWLL